MSYSEQHLRETAEVVAKLDPALCEKAVALLAEVRSRGGRLFILGVGGSAANASHAVNDFRKIAGMECYAPTDNVSELTARTNDEGWTSVFVEWLKGSRLTAKDALLVFSVGGGNVEKNVSPNLVTALQFAKERGILRWQVGPRSKAVRPTYVLVMDEVLVEVREATHWSEPEKPWRGPGPDCLDEVCEICLLQREPSAFGEPGPASACTRTLARRTGARTSRAA